MERCPPTPTPGCCFGVNDQVNPYLRNLQPQRSSCFRPSFKDNLSIPVEKSKKTEGSHLQPLKVKLLPHMLIAPRITSWCFGNSRAI